MRYTLMFFLCSFLITATAAKVLAVDFEVLGEGAAPGPELPGDSYIRSQQELDSLLGVLEIDSSEIPEVDFNANSIVFISSYDKGEASGGIVELVRIEGKSKTLMDVIYNIYQQGPVAEAWEREFFPYVIASIPNPTQADYKVRLINANNKSPLPKGYSIGQVKPYTNTFGEVPEIRMGDYFPMDRGSTWTYRIESDGKEQKDVTYTIQSVTEGWSIFDKFFGKDSIAMRIEQDGAIYVSDGKAVDTFYNDNVKRAINKDREFTTPAGTFKDLMILDLEQDDFSFTDIYANGVGLIYHEHKSPKGTAKYTLIKADVRGTKCPQ